MLRRAPSSTLFPYTTLFLSDKIRVDVGRRLDRTAAGGCLDGAEAGSVRPQGSIAGSVSQLGTGKLPREARRAAWRQHSAGRDRKSTRLNSSHLGISYAVFCL